MNTTYFLNQVMGNIFHTQEDPVIPEKYYMGLSTTAPTVDGVCDGEPSSDGTGYARVSLDYLSAPENGEVKNTAPVSFSESATDWGLITHYAVFDSATGGNLLFYGPLSSSRTVEPNTIITIKTGELVVRLSNIDSAE